MKKDNKDKIKATITDAKVSKISKLWKTKPKGLRFNDTDAVVVTAKTEDGKTISETFYFCLKPDGTFNVGTVSRDGSSYARRRRLANFLIHYKITDAIKGYKITEGVEGWKGKNVEVIPHEDGGYIYLP